MMGFVIFILSRLCNIRRQLPESLYQPSILIALPHGDAVITLGQPGVIAAVAYEDAALSEFFSQAGDVGLEKDKICLSAERLDAGHLERVQKMRPFRRHELSRRVT